MKHWNLIWTVIMGLVAIDKVISREMTPLGAMFCVSLCLVIDVMLEWLGRNEKT